MRRPGGGGGQGHVLPPSQVRARAPAAPQAARARRAGAREQVFDGRAWERFVARSPAETLLDEGRSLCSECTTSRLLAATQPGRARRTPLPPPRYSNPELVARAPNPVWSGDSTRLLGPKPWTGFSLSGLLDIFSRYVGGGRVAARDSPMPSQCTAQLLANLGVTRSLSRPRVSDDTLFSEAATRSSDAGEQA